jgi:mono/diheme cytochrome c family protein
MNSLKVGAIIVLIAFFTIACVNADTLTTNQTQPSSPLTSTPQATPDELASARANFQKNCIACHGEKGEGGRVEVDGKKLKVPNLREGHALQHTDEKFVKQISEGDDEMPAFKDKLKPEEINDLVRFVRKEFQGK